MFVQAGSSSDRERPMRPAKRLTGMGAATKGRPTMKQNMKFRMMRLTFAAASIAVFVEALGAARRF